MYSILTLNKISQSGLSHFPENEFKCFDACENPDAVIVRSASMHEMQLPENLLAIARAGAGYNNIPVDKCTQNGICVFNTPGANANAVKELVICSLFLASRKIAAGNSWANGLKGSGSEVSKKVEKGKSNFGGCEILGKTLGVVGLGAIGLLVANSASDLGMKVIGYDPYLSQHAKDSLKPEIQITDELDCIFSQADYITLHVPLTDSTRGIINAASLEKCKNSVRILNFARGELVDSSDIISSLNTGKCSSYVTDFPTDEQLGIDGVTALPHLGASTFEAEENCAVMAVEQIAEYLKNGNVKNSVNLPALYAERKGKIRISVIMNGNIYDAVNAKLENSGISVSGKAFAERNGIGYALFDTDSPIDGDFITSFKDNEGIIAIRIL